MRNVVHFLTGNLILNLAILAWAAAQTLKFFVILFTEKKIDWPMLLASGGMPSSHSSTVTAVATSVGLLYGFDSPLFAIAMVHAFIVMYDASHVRRAAGDQAKRVNFMLDNWPDFKPEEFDKNLKELLGHTPLQVLMGAILGVIIGCVGSWYFVLR